MSAQITLNWTKDSTFETLLDGHKVTIDTTAENGGNNEGPRPKALMLVALAGCSAMDVISLFLKNESTFRQNLYRRNRRDFGYDPDGIYRIPRYIPYRREHRGRRQNRESDSPFTGKILWRRTYDEKDRPDYLRYLTERRTA